MRRQGPTARVILALFDEGLGGLAAPASAVAAILKQRKATVGKANLLNTLNRLARRGELARTPRPRGGPVYTRPRNLAKTPGLRPRLEELPAPDIRRRPGTTEKRYKLREKRFWKTWADEGVRQGAHDHRPKHRCPVCGAVTPDIHLAE